MTLYEVVYPTSHTVQTAAAATGLSEDTISKAIRAGDLPATRPKIAGRAITRDQIDPDDLKRWALNRTA